MGKKRTLEDVLKALSWRRLVYQNKRYSSIIGAPRYKCFGMSSSLVKVVLYHNAVAHLKTKSEVESAVWSLIAAQPVAGKLLSEGNK